MYSCCFIYVLAAETSVLLVVPLGLRRVACTSATILHPWEGLVDSQASQPFSFVVVYTQTCNASACCLYALNDGSCDPYFYLCYVALLSLYLYELRYVVMPRCTVHTCVLCVRVTCIAMCGIRQPSCLSLVASLMGKCSLVLP